MLIVVDVWIVSWWCEGTSSLITDTVCVKYKNKLLLFWAWKARLLQMGRSPNIEIIFRKSMEFFLKKKLKIGRSPDIETIF
jgi:hypothetical protein